MQRDTTFIAPLAAALFALGIASVASMTSPVGASARATPIAATPMPISVTLPTVIVTGRRETRVAVDGSAPTSRVQ